MALGMNIPVIEWLDDSGREMVHRWPEGSGGGEIAWGAQLVCQESQSAVFFRDGRALDVFGPGRHTLTTMNLPLLTGILKLPFDGKSPFRAEVVYVSRNVFTGLKWGTKEPVPFRDAEVGVIRLRAFGTFSLRVADPQLFVNKLVGTRGVYTIDAIELFCRSVLTSRLNDILGENVRSVFDLPKLYDDVAGALKSRSKDDFGQYGTELVDLLVEAITPPDEVQKTIDTRSSMGVIGNLDQFMKYQAATALGDAGRSGEGAGGAMSAGVGLGMGAGMGAAMTGAVREAMAQGTPAPASGVACGKCGKVAAASSKFCDNCGTAIAAASACPKCHAPMAAGAKFCVSCGAKSG